MNNNTMFLPGFHLPTLRRKPRCAQQRLADHRDHVRNHSLIRLDQTFGRFIPPSHLDQASTGQFSRRRLLSKTNTFWAFFSQALAADGGCREVVRKLQAHAAAKEIPLPASSTSAYCQARSKLDEEMLQEILSYIAQQLQESGRALRWKRRRVVVVDGTGVSMPDTTDNQAIWPQQRTQKPGCGFPQARICACFCLATGALLSHRIGNRKQQELPLLRQQLDTFMPGDVLLGDKGFCSFYDVWQFQQRGVDSVFTLARRTPVTHAKAVAVLGDDDLLIEWPKPVWARHLSYSREAWEALPDRLLLRQIKVTVDVPGFRSQGYYLVTTLTDAKAFSTEDLADLYRQRWDVELYFRDLKTTMGIDILRGRTPPMVRKEILMHLIVYNAIRFLMLDAAQHGNLKPRQISFKASMQALRQWEPQISRAGLTRQDHNRLIGLLRNAIADVALLDRRGRSEPRCVKRRPKPYALLTAHRHDMIEIPHRGRHRAKAA